MKIFIYAKKITGPLELLQGVVEKVIPLCDIKKFNTSDALCQQLRRNTTSQNYKTITILLIDAQNELQDLIELRPLLAETRIILILPDKDPETIRLGHTLFPRYLDFLDSSFTEVGEVLQKIKQASSAGADQ